MGLWGRCLPGSCMVCVQPPAPPSLPAVKPASCARSLLRHPPRLLSTPPHMHHPHHTLPVACLQTPLQLEDMLGGGPKAPAAAKKKAEDKVGRRAAGVWCHVTLVHDAPASSSKVPHQHQQSASSGGATPVRLPLASLAPHHHHV